VSIFKKSPPVLSYDSKREGYDLAPCLGVNLLPYNAFVHCESEKLDPFSFEHNFGKYCPN